MNFIKLLSSVSLFTVIVYTPLANSIAMDFDYSYDSADSSAVELVGLEWMRWDITNGMSINSALDVFGGDGWRLASNTNMSDLINFYFEDRIPEYSFGDKVFSDDENVSQYNWDPSASYFPLGGIEDDLGITSNYCPEPTTIEDQYDREYYGCGTFTSALYGSDLDEDGLFNRATLEYRLIEYDFGLVSSNSLSLSSDYVLGSDKFDTSSWTQYSSGVALVRDISVTPVPVPPSLGMFGASLFALGLWRQRSKKRSQML